MIGPDGADDGIVTCSLLNVPRESVVTVSRLVVPSSIVTGSNGEKPFPEILTVLPVEPLSGEIDIEGPVVCDNAVLGAKTSIVITVKKINAGRIFPNLILV